VRQPLERRGVEMDRSALRVAAPRHQTRLFEHLNVLGHRLFGDGEGLGQGKERMAESFRTAGGVQIKLWLDQSIG
jgi:hypothetical protein